MKPTKGIIDRVKELIRKRFQLFNLGLDVVNLEKDNNIT